VLRKGPQEVIHCPSDTFGQIDRSASPQTPHGLHTTHCCGSLHRPATPWQTFGQGQPTTSNACHGRHLSCRFVASSFLRSSHTHQFNPHTLCHRGSLLSLIYAQQQVSWVIQVQSSMVAVGDCNCNGRSEPQRPPTPVTTPKDFAFTDSDHDCRACKF
jgi:hypothetical protein